MIAALLLPLALAAPAVESLAARFQGQFAVVRVPDKLERVALGFRELSVAPGRLVVYSLETGGVFADYLAPATRVDYARRLAAIGDVDGDGVDDLALSCRKDAQQRPVDVVELHSGRTGELLGELAPEVEEIAFGETLGLVPDLDGDGKPELCVGAAMLHPDRRGSFAAYALYSLPKRERLGRVISDVRSGRMGAPPLVLRGRAGHPWAAHVLGSAVVRLDLRSQAVEQSYDEEQSRGTSSILCAAALGDRNGDGQEEVLLAESEQGRHAWRLLDGLSWKPLPLPEQAGLPEGILVWLAPAGDLDGDGQADLLACQASSSGTLLLALSGRTLSVLRTLPAPAQARPFEASQCELVRPAGKKPILLIANWAPRGREEQRGVYEFDWESGALLRQISR